MQPAFALDVTLGPLSGDVDPAAPGAAVTTELCGSWQHDGPCPLAAHHTSARQDEHDIQLRILYVAEPDQAAQIAGRIRDALTAYWPVRHLATSALRPTELDHAARLSGRRRRPPPS